MHNHVHFRFGDIKTFLANLKKKKKNANNQWAFTCSKLTTEILEQGVKCVQS